MYADIKPFVYNYEKHVVLLMVMEHAANKLLKKITAVLQFISIFVAVYSEDNTTAVGTAVTEMHKSYKLSSKGPIEMGTV